jgi:hypothetical protein
MTGVASTSHKDQYIFLSYLAEFFLERKMFHTDVVEKIEKNILHSIFFPKP